MVKPREGRGGRENKLGHGHGGVRRRGSKEGNERVGERERARGVEWMRADEGIEGRGGPYPLLASTPARWLGRDEPL